MSSDYPKHHRRSIRLESYDYSQPGAYFVTVCTRNRACVLGHITDGQMRLNSHGASIQACWQELPQRYHHVGLDSFIVMPNHLHGILVLSADRRGGSRTAPTPCVEQKPLGRLIGVFKTVSTKRINEMQGAPGRTIWQRNYFERVIRNEEELRHIREYLVTNPSRWAVDRENPEVVRRFKSKAKFPIHPDICDNVTAMFELLG
ncbi:MAG: transposase [Candidatus Tectomicrobia bacterium]|nr:transposase [Candidatus Tectomicrobia bacterium]